MGAQGADFPHNRLSPRRHVSRLDIAIRSRRSPSRDLYLLVPFISHFSEDFEWISSSAVPGSTGIKTEQSLHSPHLDWHQANPEATFLGTGSCGVLPIQSDHYLRDRERAFP